MLTKEFAITLDMKRALAFHPFEVVECDTGNVLHILLQNDGAAMDLTGCDVCVVFASSKGFAMQDLTSGVSLGQDPGRIDALLYADSFGAGEVTADVQVYSGAGRETLITSRRFTFRCITSLISADSIRASATYPPLIAATRAAADAAETALTAAASVGEAVGELNVQADWNETDAVSDAYIKNKPTIPSTPGEVGAAAAVHAARHASGGADPITPTAIGAAAADALPNAHASTHAAGESDAIVRRFAIAVTATWAGTEAPYTQEIGIEGVTADMIGKIDLVLDSEDDIEVQLAQRDAFALVDRIDTGAGTVTLTCLVEAPDVAFTLQMEVVL